MAAFEALFCHLTGLPPAERARPSPTCTGAHLFWLWPFAKSIHFGAGRREFLLFCVVAVSRIDRVCHPSMEIIDA